MAWKKKKTETKLSKVIEKPSGEPERNPEDQRKDDLYALMVSYQTTNTSDTFGMFAIMYEALAVQRAILQKLQEIKEVLSEDVGAAPVAPVTKGDTVPDGFVKVSK